MANTFNTNKLTDLVAVRAAESAGYLTVGSKSYFKDQLVGKRNGQTYEFVVKDAGAFQIGPDLSATGASELSEKKVSKSLVDGAIAISTNIIEGVTDVDWDKEIAQPNGTKLANGITKMVVDADLGLQTVAFVGEGFVPLAKAAGHLKSISDDSLYGFIDPNIQAILASNGQQFVPAGAPELYKSGLLGNFHGVEYRSSRWMPTVEIGDDLVTEIAASKVTSYTDNGDGTATLKLASITKDIPKGTPVYIAGVYATDIVGDKTSNLAAFIAVEDATAGSVKVRAVEFTGEGTKTVCDSTGKELTAAKLAGKAVSVPPAGTYHAGIVRVDGAMEFDTLDKLDWSNADSKTSSVAGVTVHENRAVDSIKGSNVTRFDIVALAGIVEPRACVYVLVKG